MNDYWFIFFIFDPKNMLGFGLVYNNKRSELI